MKRIKLFIAVTVVLLFFVNQCCAGMKFGIIKTISEKIGILEEKVEEFIEQTGNNKSPSISRLTSDTVVTNPGAIVNVVCTADDPDADTLSYQWTVSGGSVTGSGSNITWIAPSSAGSYIITCIVKDGNGGSDQKSIVISVL